MHVEVSSCTDGEAATSSPLLENFEGFFLQLVSNSAGVRFGLASLVRQLVEVEQFLLGALEQGDFDRVVARHIIKRSAFCRH